MTFDKSNKTKTVLFFERNLHNPCLHQCSTYPGQSVLGLESLGILQCVVDEPKASRLATTKLCAEAETEDDIRCSLVHARQLFSDFCLGYSGPPWVKNIHNLKKKSSWISAHPSAHVYLDKIDSWFLMPSQPWWLYQGEAQFVRTIHIKNIHSLKTLTHFQLKHTIKN